MYIDFRRTYHLLCLCLHFPQIWTDPRLIWKPAEYGGLKTVRFPNNIIWKPDVILLNAYVFS